MDYIHVACAILTVHIVTIGTIMSHSINWRVRKSSLQYIQHINSYVYKRTHTHTHTFISACVHKSAHVFVVWHAILLVYRCHTWLHTKMWRWHIIKPYKTSAWCDRFFFSENTNHKRQTCQWHSN